MLRKITGTAGSKIFSALIGFIIISINANLLGAEAVGTIALIILGITISMLVSSLGGGAALVYLVPRENTFNLFIPSFLWTVLTAFAVIPLLSLFNWIPQQYTEAVILLSILRGLSNNNTTILLGKERIHASNWLAIIEIIVLLLSVLGLYFFLNSPSVDHYVLALELAYAANVLCGLLMVGKYLKVDVNNPPGFIVAFRKIIRYSFYIQSASFFQLLNYRLGYYFLEFFSGRGSLGIYSVGVRLSESLWIVGKSITTVQYARISNTDNRSYSRDLTVLFFKSIFVITIVLIGILLLIPESAYLWIFSDDFSGVKEVMIYLSIGVLSLACSMAFSSYFSGIGKQHLNTVGSLIGLGFTIIGALILIPALGIKGAALTASVSYTSTFLYYLLRFLKVADCSFSAFLPSKNDFLKLKEILKKSK